MNKKGFTIIEVLVALALFTVLSVTLFASFRSYTATIKRERQSSSESVNIQQFNSEIEEYVRMSTQDIVLTKAFNSYMLKDVDESLIKRHDRKIELVGTTVKLYKEPFAKPSEFIVLSNNFKSLDMKIKNNKLIIEIESTIPGMRKTIKQIKLRGQFSD